MLGLLKRPRRKTRPSTPLLDELNVTTLREAPDVVETVIVGEQEIARNDPSVEAMLRSLFLLPDRSADFDRFAGSVECATILKLLRAFGVTTDHRLVEIGGGPGFLAWALHRAGFRIDLVEPNRCWNTGTGYLRSRKDAREIELFDDHVSWHESPTRYDVLITKNCIHHFQNIAQVALSLRQKLSEGGKWFAFREWYADSPTELGEQLANHPYCQKFGLYEWPYPAHHYVESIEIAGFRLEAVVPAGYANDCLAMFSEGPWSDDVRRSTDKLDALLARTPQDTVESFWHEVGLNREKGVGLRLYTRPQAMIFRRI